MRILSWGSFPKPNIFSSCRVTTLVIYIIQMTSRRSKHEMIKQEAFNQAALGEGGREKELNGYRVLETGESITWYFSTNFCSLSKTKWV